MSSSSYSANEFDTNYPVGMENYYWTYARNRILLRELKRNGLADKKLLEIGCATGLVVSYLRKNGINILGVELGNADVLPDVKDVIFNHQDCLDLPQDFRESVEVLMLLDVIEHIEDPAGFLKSVVDRYPNASEIVISVPARAELWSSYDVEYRHFRRYDYAMVRQNVAALPFQISRMDYLFKVLYPPAWLASKTSGKRNHVVRPPLTKAMIRIHRILSFVLYLDYLILPRALWGSSILAVLKRKNTQHS
jgi:2-polyprenyl-3-methyl-5-hydroxy-6-metoxy-1,4-benzoquinol methylase